jgi:hypothetical protein
MMESIKDNYCLKCGIEIDFGQYCDICTMRMRGKGNGKEKKSKHVAKFRQNRTGRV